MFIEAFFTITLTDFIQWLNGSRRCGVYAEKEGNPVIYDDMDGPYHYAKQNKSDKDKCYMI